MDVHNAQPRLTETRDSVVDVLNECFRVPRPLEEHHPPIYSKITACRAEIGV